MPDSLIFLLNYSEHFIYTGLFLILILSGLGLPIPEEITLLAGGFFVYLEFTRFYPTMVVIFAGAIAGDMTLYSIGRKWGQGIITHRQMRKIFSEKRLERARRFFAAHGSKAIFIARFFSGFRVAAFLAAGTMGMKPGKVLLYDTFAALIMVPVLVSVGCFFGENISWLISLFTRIDFLLKLLFILACLGALTYLIIKIKKPSPKK